VAVIRCGAEGNVCTEIAKLVTCNCQSIASSQLLMKTLDMALKWFPWFCGSYPITIASNENTGYGIEMISLVLWVLSDHNSYAK
jgi:hypothetical protein